MASSASEIISGTASLPPGCQEVGYHLNTSFAWMGNLAALKAKLREIGYDGDGDMVVGGVIAAEVIVHLTAADMHIDYDAA